MGSNWLGVVFCWGGVCILVGVELPRTEAGRLDSGDGGYGESNSQGLLDIGRL